ncbi:hypothetical protein CJ235_10475 [Staphylococcus pettenkoferi]|uniref:DUF5079 domain-containing protein n=1 Tax=Staphylococcus pettenkoferi TaxID=170573 RepID=A0A2N6QD32_9STAP|nr:hypothetical protein HMPREF2802_09410 [Staphylococcus sp. HMSC071G07]PMC17433.1 hypothetical protein CJ235_10475 [Staphylococcus pettenkoferi]
MRELLDKYYFTITFATILILFAFPKTDIFTTNLLFYLILFLEVLFSTFIVETILNNRNTLQQKAKKFCVSLLPINIIIITIFFVFIM